MSNEIKELLDKLKLLCYDDYCLEFSVDYIERKEEKLLLDYITNLQEENERLKKPDYYEKGLIGSIKERDEIIQGYKSRCEKAIPMLKELNKKLKDILHIGIDIAEIADIENILTGGDKDRNI